jgi:hypothetical protein
MSKFPTIKLNPNKKYDSKLSFLSPHILITLHHFIFCFWGWGRDKFSPLSDGKKSNATHTEEFCGKKKVPK